LPEPIPKRPPRRRRDPVRSHPAHASGHLPMRKPTTMKNDRGFTLVEVLVAAMILTVALLTLATMFPTGYKQIADAGRLTLATNGANHILEDLGSVPFTSVRNLDNFDTNSSGSLPAADPELAIARRWRYMLAGSGSGFSFT